MRRLPVLRVAAAAIVFVGAVVVVDALLWSPPVTCETPNAEPATPESPPSSPPVRSNEPWVGVLVAERSADIAAPRAGRVDAIPVELAQRVRRGDALVRLDGREAGIARNLADQRRRSSAATMRQARARHQAAKRKRRRAAVLWKQRLIPQEEFDDAQHEAEAAALDVAAARADRDGRSAQLAAAELAEDETVLRAPFDGVVVGRYVNAGERVEPESPLLRVADPSRLRVRFAVPEADFDQIAVGQALTVQRSGGTAVRVVVLRVAQEIDPVARVGVAESAIESVPDAWPIGGTLEVRR